VISPLGRESGSGETLNVNADLAAAALASSLKPAKLVYISDVPGLLRDAADPDSLIQSIDAAQAEALLANGTITGGMIPKIEGCLDVIAEGVEAVVIINGKVPHAVLLELFTEHGAGTLIERRRRKSTREAQ
jgi:acetylglutamate kinase